MPKAPRFVPHFALAALLLGSTALGSSAQAGWFDSSSKPEGAAKDAKAAPPVSPAANLEESVSQAQALRLAGSYPEAIRHLSQLMMVASDDSRVVSEYGKTLAAMGRSQEGGDRKLVADGTDGRHLLLWCTRRMPRAVCAGDLQILVSRGEGSALDTVLLCTRRAARRRPDGLRPGRRG